MFFTYTNRFTYAFGKAGAGAYLIKSILRDLTILIIEIENCLEYPHYTRPESYRPISKNYKRELKVPKILLNKKVLALDLTGIVAGTKYRGEFEKRLKQIADEITAAERSIILFIDEIHTLAEAGGAEGAIDADDILKPALARGDLQVIGATTAEEYKKFIKNDVTLDRRLHPILIDEPTKEETIKILQGIKRKYEQFHKANITNEAILAAVHLAAEHIKGKSFPDKAIDLMDEAASKVSIENVEEQFEAEKKGEKPKLNGKIAVWPQVGVAEVQEVMQEWQVAGTPNLRHGVYMI